MLFSPEEIQGTWLGESVFNVFCSSISFLGKFCYILESDISDLDEYEFQNDVIYGNEILRPYRPYLQKETVKNYPYKHRLNKRQVAEDCCRKACTREYIKNTYCGYRRENTH